MELLVLLQNSIPSASNKISAGIKNSCQSGRAQDQQMKEGTEFKGSSSEQSGCWTGGYHLCLWVRDTNDDNVGHMPLPGHGSVQHIIYP